MELQSSVTVTPPNSIRNGNKMSFTHKKTNSQIKKIKKRPFNTEYLCPHPTLTVITKSVPFCVYDRVKANFLKAQVFFWPLLCVT